MFPRFSFAPHLFRTNLDFVPHVEEGGHVKRFREHSKYMLDGIASERIGYMFDTTNLVLESAKFTQNFHRHLGHKTKILEIQRKT